MPKNKDLKRLVRARMAKTGESYTAARLQIVKAKAKAGAEREAEPAAPPPDYAALAGKRDEVMKARTGRTWAEWLEVLDAIGATSKTHAEIARYVQEELGIDGWWAQTVTVGYERIRGLRAVHQRRGGHFEMSKSKTVPVPVSDLYAAFADGGRRELWLPGVALRVRTTIADKSMRITWPDGTNVEAQFVSKGPAKSSVTVVHSKLASAEAVAQAKAYWGERLAALAEVLTAR